MLRQPAYRITEVFYSIQGEGANAGLPTVFIRFAGCNLNCVFCDTDYSEKIRLNGKDLLEIARAVGLGCPNVLLTGGEPAIQTSASLIDLLHTKFNWIGIESNGTIGLPGGIDYVTISPKKDTLIQVENVDEVRIPLENGEPLPEMKDLPTAKYYYVSPIFDGLRPVLENVTWALEKVKETPKWRLSIQTHKLIGIR